MANSKQKPVPEGAKRSPGKSKFSIPRKEAPPIDGSYLDRLFADYEQQTKAVEGVSVEDAQVEALQQPVVEEQKPEILKETAAISPQVEVPSPAISSPPVPIPTEVEEVQESNEVAQAPPPEIPQLIETPTIAEDSVEKAAELGLMPPALNEEIIQRLVKLHRLSKGEAGVLRVMIRLCQERESDTCYIKIPQLMAITGLKDRQTQRVLRSLSELQLIEKVADYSNANRLGTQYRVIPFHD